MSTFNIFENAPTKTKNPRTFEYIIMIQIMSRTSKKRDKFLGENREKF